MNSETQPKTKQPNLIDRYAAIPLCVITDRRLTLRQLRVLLVLFKHRNVTRAEKQNHVWPLRKTISKWTGYKESLISTITTELVELGWLRKKGNGGNSRSVRYILSPTVSGSDAEALVQRIICKEKEPETDYVDGPMVKDAETTKEPTGRVPIAVQNMDPRVPKTGTEGSPNRVLEGSQIGEGHRSNKEDIKEIINEDVCARDKLAHSLVEHFIHLFKGLGTGGITTYSTKDYDTWCADVLALIDDGVSRCEIESIIDWLLSENRTREHEGNYPFVVRTPTDLRMKWARLYDAAAKDRNWAHSLDESVGYIKVANLRRYVIDLLNVPYDRNQHIETVHLSRLLDPQQGARTHCLLFLP